MKLLIPACLVLILASPFALPKSLTPLELFPNGRHGDLIEYNYLQILVLPETIPFETILKEQYQDQWHTPSSHSVNRGVTDDWIWIRFKVSNNSQLAGEWYLEVLNPLINEVQFRQSRNGRFDEVQESGLSHSLDSQPIPHLSPLFPITLNPTEESWVYLGVRQSAYRNYTPLKLWPKNVFLKHDRTMLIIFSMTMGVFLIMAIYNLLLFYYTNDTSYFFYSNCVFSFVLFLLSSSGYGRLYAWGDSDWFLESATPLFGSWCFFSSILFFRHIIHISTRQNFVLAFNNALLIAWLLVVLGLLTPIKNNLATFSAFLGLFTVIAGFLISIFLWRKQHRLAIYFAISWGGILLSTFAKITVAIGLFPYFEAVDYIQTISFLLQTLLLSLALADRIKSEIKSRQEAQSLALKQQKVIINMQKDANQELEKNVLQRTKELASVAADLERANEALAAQNRIDSLTQIYNRRYFDETIRNEIQRSIRNQSPLALMLVDIDHFKSINDTYGHTIGDKCLKLIAKNLLSIISRDTDIVSRYGGEEFAIILPDTNSDSGKIVAEKVRKKIENLAFISNGQKITLTVSIGITSSALKQNDTSEFLINAADEALYAAKKAGRNRVICKEPKSKTNSQKNTRDDPDFATDV